jgi:hypothetical protein
MIFACVTVIGCSRDCVQVRTASGSPRGQRHSSGRRHDPIRTLWASMTFDPIVAYGIGDFTDTTAAHPRRATHPLRVVRLLRREDSFSSAIAARTSSLRPRSAGSSSRKRSSSLAIASQADPGSESRRPTARRISSCQAQTRSSRRVAADASTDRMIGRWLLPHVRGNP